MAITAFIGKYRFLSNFYPTPRSMPPTLEHHYQRCKVSPRLPWRDHANIEGQIIRAATPQEAKKLANTLCTGVNRDTNFEAKKLDTMKELVRQKFWIEPGLRDRLINTGEEELIEGNYWHDQFWGMCTCVRCVPFIPGQKGFRGKGENNLGKILMKVREELKTGKNPYGFF